jgi:hypothetical protein
VSRWSRLLPALVLSLGGSLATAQPASPQGAAPSPAPAADVEFLPDFNFRFALEKLSGSDPRFVWDSHWGGELDLLRLHGVRFVMVADYEAVLGREYQPFDPNQGNYTLGGFVARKVGGVEVAAVMHHVSRHFGDRPKRFGIAWNMYGGRLRAERVRGPLWVEGRLDLRGATNHAYVDYLWELDASVRSQRRVSGSAHVIGAANLRRVGVDGSRNRGDQTGLRLEGGMRFDGKAAALEVFVGAERRIDPYQTEFGTTTWALVGARVVRR